MYILSMEGGSYSRKRSQMDHHERVSVISFGMMSNADDSPDVEYCGYSAPHPSEAKIHLRIQMYGECTLLYSDLP